MIDRSWLVATLAIAALVGLAACGDSVDSAPPSGSLAPPSLSLAPDAGLLARFPKTVDGQPVVIVQNGRFEDVLLQLGAPDATISQVSATLSGAGIDFETLTAGFATVTVGGVAVQISALRTPNADASLMATNYAVLAAAFGTAFGSAESTAPTTSASTAGGKPVTLVAYPDGNQSVLYVAGDTMFILDNTTDAQTNAIVSAIP